MKRGFLTLIFTICFLAVFAQNNEIMNLRLEARADYQQEYLSSSKMNDNSGFKGKFLNIRIDGNISDEFSYSYRQRLNKPNKDASFFDATDWIYLTYSKKNWSLTAGKVVVAIGGYEYDRAPIDLYFCSEYWNNIPCYRVGANVAYSANSGKDKFIFQFCESPFRDNALNVRSKEMFAYNLMWCGSHDWFNTIYSLNMIEYLPGKYINYIALGNRFVVGDFSLELDLMNRATSEHVFIGRNLSVMGELSWRPMDCLNVFGKATYDVNKTDDVSDFCVMSGTEVTRIGGGVEFFPLKNSSHDVRLHLAGSYTWGGNGNIAGALQPDQTFLSVGVTWRMNMLSIKRK